MNLNVSCLKEIQEKQKERRLVPSLVLRFFCSSDPNSNSWVPENINSKNTEVLRSKRRKDIQAFTLFTVVRPFKITCSMKTLCGNALCNNWMIVLWSCVWTRMAPECLVRLALNICSFRTSVLKCLTQQLTLSWDGCNWYKVFSWNSNLYSSIVLSWWDDEQRLAITENLLSVTTLVLWMLPHSFLRRTNGFKNILC